MKIFRKTLFSFKVQVDTLKLFCMIFGTWLLVSFLISTTGAISSSNFHAFVRNGSNGDYGILVIFTIIVAVLSDMLINYKSRAQVLIFSLLLFMLAFPCLIGTLITKADLNAVLMWTIPLIFILIIDFYWILLGSNLIKLSTTKYSAGKLKTNSPDPHSITQFNHGIRGRTTPGGGGKNTYNF